MDPPGMPSWYRSLRDATRPRRDLVDEGSLTPARRESLLDIVSYTPKPTPREEWLRDGTEFVKRILQRPIPRRAIELVTVPVFGKQGFGKSKLVNYLVDLIIQRHGAEKVNCIIGNDFRALQDSIDPAKPVQILFLDDALDSAFSRGGTPVALRDAIKDFMKTRHKLEKAMRILHGEEVDERAETMDNMHHAGLIYVFIGSQSFKGLEKQFRAGLCIFKSPLEEDMQEISQYWEGSTKERAKRTRQRDAAWELLFDVQQRKLEEHDLSALSDCIVVVPSRGPMKLHAPLLEREYFEPPYGRRVRYEPKKAEQQLEARLHLTTHLANLFNQQHDPTRNGAQGLLRDLIKTHLLRIHLGEVQDELLKVPDAPELLKSDLIRDVLDRAKVLRLERSRATLGLPVDLSDEDAIIRKVSTDWLATGADPLQRQNGVAGAKLYAFILDEYREQRDFRQRAEQLQAKVLRLATALYLDNPRQVPPPAAPPARQEAPSAPTGPEFTFDVEAWLDELPERMARTAPQRAKSPAEERERWARRCLVYRKRRFEGVSREDLALGTEALVGETLTGRNLDHWTKEVESCLGMWMGGEYERWWKRMLDEGWRHDGLHHAAITSVQVGGGSGHEPDVTVHYQDSQVDYWSLKCYTAREHLTLNVHNLGAKKRSDVAPELAAFLKAWQAREGDDSAPRPRLCVAFREVQVQGAEFYRVFERPDQLVPTATFSRSELGQRTSLRWRRG